MAKKKEEPVNSEEQAIEERVRQMMEPERKSAPDLAPANKISIKVSHDDEDKAATAAAIEEANQQLEAATAPELTTAGSKRPKIVPIKTDEPETSEEETPKEEPAPEPEEEPAAPIPEEEASESETEAEETAPEEPLVDEPEEPIPPVVEDPGTDKIVEEIQAAESDKLLEEADAGHDLAHNDALVVAPYSPPGIKDKLVSFLKKPAVRWTVCIALLLGVAGAAANPDSRYYVLNTAGVRSSTQLTVLDESTSQPLKNVRVTIGEATGTTDGTGHVSISNVRLGDGDIVIERRAFAKLSQKHTFGWGSNPLGEFKLKPTGTQYSFIVTDHLSGKPISKVEATSKDASALSDDKGLIKLTTDDKESEKMTVTLKSEGYRDEVLIFDADETKAKAVKMVHSRKHVFVSKRAGKFDVYKVDIDGKNEERILAGTGTEREDMVLVSHPTSELVAIVSTRENKRNRDGFLLSTLTIIDLKNNETKSVATSERVQIVDWLGNRLIYVAIGEGQSGNSPSRHRLMSYEYSSADNKQLAASNFFNDVLAVSGKLYYAPSSAYQKNAEVGLFRVDADGNNKQIIMAKETWNVFRTSHNHLVLALPGSWYDYRIGDAAPVKLEGAPANQTSRVYIDSPDGKRSLWVDNRDGKGTLLYYDFTAKNDAVVRSQSGLKYPLRWISNNVLIYRVHTDELTADYVLNIDGGEPKLLRDVTDVGGIDKWYYY